MIRRIGTAKLANGVFAAMVLAAPAVAQRDIYDSGGPLPREQAAYDVTFYDLAIGIMPHDSTIWGTLTAYVRVLEPLDVFVLDLDTLLEVANIDLVTPTAGALEFERRGGQIWAHLPSTMGAGTRLAVAVEYGGQPLSTPHEPNAWSDGFVWAETESGEPWVGVVSVLNGADIWWPTKDHPSDKPDSMAIRVTVPGSSLRVASNGRLRSVTDNEDGTTTHYWFVASPISNYSVTANIAPYRLIEETFESVTGNSFPAQFWVLPEHYEQAQARFPEFLDALRFYESILGPFPFQVDKYGVAETPYLGMENQSIISYGWNFENDPFGFDWLHFHELSHEWWANMVTARDWKDWWLHEGFGSYMEALYAEQIGGEEAYLQYMRRQYQGFDNEQPVAPRESQTSRSIYNNDIYNKGSWILHSLRYLVGRDTLMMALRRMVYPDPNDETATDGCRCRFADTDEFQTLVEQLSGRDLDWFFNVYVHSAAMPQLLAVREGGETWRLEWLVEGEEPFPMPIEVAITGQFERVEMPDGVARIEVPVGERPVVDPRGRVLRARVGR